MYTSLFFDVDDTLLNFELCSHIALCKTFDFFNIEFNEKVYTLFRDIDHQLWSMQKQGLLAVEEVLNFRFERLFDCLNLEIDTIKFQSSFQEYLAKEFVLEPNAMQVIQALSTKYKLYVTSNGILKMQLERLKLAGLLPYFSDIFVSDEIGYDKPNIKFFEECLKRSQLHFKDILLIGDSLEADMIGANKSNIATCWYNPNNRIKNIDIKTDYIISNLLQLRKIL